MTKAPISTEHFKKQSHNTNTPPNISITQQLGTDLRRLVELITTIFVWLTGLRAEPSNFPQQHCNKKDAHFKNVNNPPY